MYITINNQTYADVLMTRRRNGDTLFTGESLDVTEVSGEIITYRNDGFELRRDNVSDYLRTEVSAGRVLLTNQPVPPEPAEPQIRDDEAVAIITDTLTTSEALNIITGGTT